jgi:nucleoside-diphosphate-sugar epimerase
MPSRKFAAWASDPQARLAIVGASGWIGQALVDQALAEGFPPERIRLFTRTPRPIAIRGAVFSTEALDDSTRLDDGGWIVAHAGIIGPDRAKGDDHLETRQRNDALLAQVLGMAQGADVRRLVMMSSGAARQAPGHVARPAYVEMKRAHEARVADWGGKTGTPVLLPRVFNLGGPYINYVRNYALGDFIMGLAGEGQIVLGAADPVVRSYVHLLELAAVLLEAALDEAQGPEPCDIGGTETVELGDLARMVATCLGLVDPVIERPPPLGGAGDIYVADGERYQAILAGLDRTPVPLDQIITDTITYLRQMGDIS